MNALWLAFDIILALALLGLAWRLLTTPDTFQAIVLFVVFGLLVALAWVRLQAPDVALAEAAIGAGLTGALLLSFLGGATPRPRAGSSGRRRAGRIPP